MAISEPYDEAIIVSLLTEVYKLQQLLDYYPESDSVTYPPDGGHVIDEESCTRAKLSPDVISLMKKIPYPKDHDTAGRYHFVYQSPALVYTEKDRILRGRDPAAEDLEHVKGDFLKPSELSLTLAHTGGVHIILDTEENTIRWWYTMDHPAQHWPKGSKERDVDFWGEEWDNYRNFPAKPAPEALKELADKYRTLEWIPKRINWPEIIGECNPLHADAKRRLVTEYGWPDNFKREAYVKDMERFWWEVDPENKFVSPEADMEAKALEEKAAPPFKWSSIIFGP